MRIKKASAKVPTVEDNVLHAKQRLTELKAVQQEARDEELAIREYLADQFHDGVEGSKTVTVGEIKFTVGRTLTRSITKDAAEELCRDLPELAETCLSWRPEVKVGEYKKNPTLLDKYIVTKAGPPTVEFKS